jgi:hypothetical protein
MPQPTSEAGGGAIAPDDANRNSSAGAVGTPLAGDTTAEGEFTIYGDDRTAAPAGDDSVSLPLWQLQAGLGALAVMMAALWLYLRRRAAV